MATIYRVEHADTNEGPFRGEFPRISHDIMLYYNANDHGKGKWPTPDHDGIDAAANGNLPYCMIFGCMTIELLIYWFPKQFHDDLANAGFVIAVYETDDGNVLHGKHQCAFDEYEAKRVNTFCLDQLDNLMAMAA